MAATARVRNPIPFIFALLFFPTKTAADRISYDTYSREHSETRLGTTTVSRRTPYEPHPPLGALVSQVTFLRCKEVSVISGVATSVEHARRNNTENTHHPIYQ